MDSDAIPWSEWPQRLWGYGIGYDPDTSFCLHALVADGLKVPPWDRHQGGDGRLQAVGLTAELWARWFKSVVHARIQNNALVLWPAWQRSTEWPPSREALQDPPEPPRALDLWDGPEQVGEELRKIPKPPEPVVAGPLHAGASRSGHPDPLWDEIQRYRGQVPHFWVLLVPYPFMVVQALRPAAIVMTERVVLNPDIYRGMLLGALTELVTK
jgi:hypothetical protein